MILVVVVVAPSSLLYDILPGRRRRYPSSSPRTTRRATTTTTTRAKSDDEKEGENEETCGGGRRIDEKRRRFHWSEKLKRGPRESTTVVEGEEKNNFGPGRSSTRDELRMMPKAYFVRGDVDVKPSAKSNIALNMQEVHRDRDTSILVTDAQLEREFMSDEVKKKKKENNSTEEENGGPMTERLLLLLPSLRSANKKANTERLVEDLLFRVGLERVSSRLLTMRKLFPTCDVAEMATKNPKVYLKFSNTNGDTKNGYDDEKDEREWQLEIEKLERMFPFAGQNGLPNVQRMVQAVPQILDSEFVERSVDALIFSGLAKDAADAKTKLHQNPWVILRVESAHNRSRFESASHFDQTNVKRNKVVYDTKNGEKYYDDVTRTAQKM